MDDTLVLWDEITEHSSDFVETPARIIPEIDDDLAITCILCDGSECLYEGIFDSGSEGRNFDMMISIIELLVFDVVDGDFGSGNREIEFLSSSADMELDTGSLKPFDFIDRFPKGGIFIDGEIINLEDHIATLETGFFCGSTGDWSDDVELTRFWHVDVRADSLELTIEFILEIFGLCRWKIRSMFIFARICHTLRSSLDKFLIFELCTIVMSVLELKIDVIEDREVRDGIDGIETPESDIGDITRRRFYSIAS